MKEPFDPRWSEIYVGIENRTEAGFEAHVQVDGGDSGIATNSFPQAWAECGIPKELEPDWSAVEKLMTELPVYIEWWAQSSGCVSAWNCSLTDERTGKNFILASSMPTLEAALTDAVEQFKRDPR